MIAEVKLERLLGTTPATCGWHPLRVRRGHGARGVRVAGFFDQKFDGLKFDCRLFYAGFRRFIHYSYEATVPLLGCFDVDLGFSAGFRNIFFNAIDFFGCAVYYYRRRGDFRLSHRWKLYENGCCFL